MIQAFNPDVLLVFLPALFRIGGILLAGPLWSHVRVPLTVRTGAALMITVALWPRLSGSQPLPAVDGLVSFALLIAGEVLVGVLMGVAANLVFVAVDYAGQLVGVSIGLAIVNVLDPIYHAQISIVSRLYRLFALAVFFALNAHHLIVLAVSRSFDILPVGTVSVGAVTFVPLFDLGLAIFEVGVRIAAPIIGVLLLAELAMGLVVRTVPQMNIFIVGFPLKIGLGFFMIAITLPHLVTILERLFVELDRTLLLVIRGT